MSMREERAASVGTRYRPVTIVFSGSNEIYIWVSSAYMWYLQCLIFPTMSAVYKENNTGASIDPCATPFVTGRQLDLIFAPFSFIISTICSLHLYLLAHQTLFYQVTLQYRLLLLPMFYFPQRW